MKKTILILFLAIPAPGLLSAGAAMDALTGGGAREASGNFPEPSLAVAVEGAGNGYEALPEYGGEEDFFADPGAAALVPFMELRHDMDKSVGVRMTGRREAELEAARRLALDYLSDAYSKSGDKLFLNVKDRLAKAPIKTPDSGSNFAKCGEKTIAFVIRQEHINIYFCQRAFKYLDVEGLAQTLIHESTHLAGVHDECRTTRVEIEAMMAGQGSLAYRNGYVKKCGLESIAGKW